MGLRTASVRHPHVEVMAPALTETNQSQSFKLPPDQSASPINGIEKNGDLFTVLPLEATTGKDLNNDFDNLNTLALATELLKANTSNGASDNKSAGFMMSNCPPPMGDHQDKMGLQKSGLDEMSPILKDKTELDDDQLFNLTSTDIGQVDEIMQVIKSMEGNSDRISSVPDLSNEQDSIFPLSSSDLETGNITNFEKALFEYNDVINLSMDEQLMETTTTSKETQTKDFLADIQGKQTKLERKMDFLIRRIRKFQVKNMGQHISGEVAGVFEHVHRTLRRYKEQSAPSKSDDPTIEPIIDNKPKPIPSDKMKPISYSSTKNLIKKLEMSTAVQANNSTRQRHVAKYFGSGSQEPSSLRSNMSGFTTLPQWAPEEKQELQRVSGFLESELYLVQDEVDSEATVSSSGGESCDEMQNYNNPHQQYLPIQKRAAWRYAKDRAAIACRWTWLQSQVSDLEYRIRQHSDLHRKIRASKESVRLGGASPPHGGVPTSPTCVNGYRGQLPGASPIKSSELTFTPESSKRSTSETPANGTISTCPDIQCARTRPLVNFRKRKLLQITGLHAVSKKAARPSSIKCGCVPPETTCALCTGRTDPTHPRDVTDYLSKNEKLGLLDPCYHPVFSLNEDASAVLHMEAIMKTPEWQQKSSRTNVKPMKYVKSDRSDKSGSIENRPRKIEHRKKYNRLLKPATVNALSAKIKNRFRGRKGVRHSPMGRLKKRSRVHSHLQALGSDGADDEVEALGVGGSGGKYDSPSTSPLLTAQSISSFQRRNRTDSYDIDNIIIPYSVAASTRVEKLQYKEILTPKWRIVEGEAAKYDLKNNGTVKPSQENKEFEDLSDEALLLRHEKSEQEEKKKFLSFLKLPIGYGRSRANRRTDSRAESSGANTPDPMSPAPVPPAVENSENAVSPPATPLPPITDENTSINSLRRRTISQSRVAKDKEVFKEETRCNSPEHIEEPYEKRVFPLNDEMLEYMLSGMPDEHKMKTNARSQDSSELASPTSEYDDKLDDHDSESTESAYGDEDPNDPEWDLDHIKERSRR